MKSRIIGILGEDGVISRALSGYESRPEQIKMAEAVCEAIECGKHLLVEAGTGIGKSLAYLVPFIIHAVEGEKKIVISTNTKTLQQQLCQKDLPFLKRSLGIEFDFTLCLGSENYLCKRRLNSSFTYDLFETDAQAEDLKKIMAWSERAERGIKSDLEFVPRGGVWDNVCRDPDLCIGNKCHYNNGCFYRKAKSAQKNAHVLIVNHSLFFTNLSAGGQVLPQFDAVVFDEAHTLEEAAAGCLGYEVSNTQVKYLLDSIYNSKTKRGLLSKFKRAKHQIGVIQHRLEEARTAAMQFFNAVSEKFGSQSDVKRIRTANIIYNYLDEPLKGLTEAIKGLIDCVNKQEDEVLLRFYVKRCIGLRASLEFILSLEEKADYVYWVEVAARRRGIKYSLLASPIEIAEELDNQLFSIIKPVVLTSATLAVNNNFSFIRKRLGIKDCIEALLNSPFDYKKNVTLYLPRNIADPGNDQELFLQQALEHIKRIIDVMGGRTFILFTSFRMLNFISKELKSNYKDILLLRQGERPRYTLLEEFKKNSNAVLLGTNSFWQGVDVPGRALECVVIAKLPFLVPDDPITEARTELIESRNGNPFTEYQIPQAIMMFKQGFGRLIRNKTDRGVVAVLDPRISTKYYGKSFINAIPECGHIYDINDIKEFFKAACP
ncbi:MAG: DEAD/DEAH box helicase [Candidatus Omnitrophica bacterium]|nr:DEAD/DEAH box helicase [Candidatus Omnitrophota bacterium]